MERIAFPDVLFGRNDLQVLRNVKATDSLAEQRNDVVNMHVLTRCPPFGGSGVNRFDGFAVGPRNTTQ
ncbi:hypothetical protein [Pseudoxanthomonas winnipegensis]|uniref:Uncharacterized protein n=1 Tax=Pseudoxanthomonas winnipegensis TaxID=2480810 RepID=A0A4Q8LAR6_9GAMM|nr:hypothetical protein [Pseudoxanthomonas winnipegensis]RZZ81424.1 hypothetical protein EA663_20595 [Pseudoxanthomonas winnipegensis]TAA25419.1 hypothetical protein EA660_08135 [Pseudoxanthomonas winnipegensis]